MARRQAELAGMERERIKEIDDAAEAYVKLRNARMRATDKEVPAKEALIAAMKKHKVASYLDNEASPPLQVILTPGKDQVKVTELEPGGDDDEDETDKAAA
jgi:hypothetical protein